jgi:hypothetical protein
MTVKSTTILDQIKPEDRNLLQSKTLIRKFGRPEDCVELHVYNLNNKLLKTVYNFEDYTIPDIDDPQGYFSEIIFNPDKALRDLGFTSGEYKIRVNFHRRKIANSFENTFYIDTISSNRTELKVQIRGDENVSSLAFATNQFIAELSDDIEGASYFKDFAVNLGNDIILTGVNFIPNQGDANSFLIKLYEPLPNAYNGKIPFRVIEELTNPIEYNVNLESSSQITIDTTELRGPNLRIDTRLNSSVPSAYKAYNDILQFQSSGSFNNLLGALSSSIPISIEYDNPNTTSGYTYENFTHFSSAEERLRNFKYKLELIELYTSKSAYIGGLYHGLTNYPTQRQSNIDLSNNVINNFDNYERYLYYESGTYAWPKSTTLKPHTLYPVTASQSTTWFEGNIISSSDFDDQNIHILRNTLPQYIIENDENDQFITFVDMMGQYFDNIWLYIENITDKNIAHNGLKEGISKDIVFNALKEKGIPAFDQFENANLFEYLIGSYTGSNSFVYQAPAGQTMITASNESIPKGDITKEVWKRLYHNAPYLLKTKGTERGIKALMACYGIPETILHVKEYGGPSADKSGFRTFKYPKTTKALSIKGVNETPFVEFGVFDNSIYGGQCTVEFTIIPDKKSQNIILGDTYTNGGQFLVLTSSSIFDYAAKPDFAHFGSSYVNVDGPWFTGNPITVFIQRSPVQGGLASYDKTMNITLSTYVDGQCYTATHAHDFGEPIGTPGYYRMVIGTPGTTSANNISSSLALQHFKIYTSSLSSEVKEIHTKDPSIIAGNTTSSYFDGDLYYYNPLGGNLITESVVTNYKFKDYSGGTDHSANDVTPKALKSIEYTNVTYDHHISTPDTVGSSMASEKIRYDQGTIEDNILSPFVRAEGSALDRQPPDYSTLGIFFSPTFEINEDIIYTLGGFRLDDYIGDPRDLASGSYPSLKSLSDEYQQKVTARYNFFDYIRTIQFFDHTLFKMIEEFVPAKANLKTGVVIEPHYLERNKFTFANNDYSLISNPDIILPSAKPTLDSEYLLQEATINVEEVLAGSGGSFENNFVYSRLSSKYYRQASNR